MDRFNLTDTQRKFINTTVNLGLLDAVDVYCMAQEHEAFSGFREEVMQIAHINRTSPGGVEINAALCELNDAICVEERAKA